MNKEDSRREIDSKIEQRFIALEKSINEIALSLEKDRAFYRGVSYVVGKGVIFIGTIIAGIWAVFSHFYSK